MKRKVTALIGIASCLLLIATAAMAGNKYGVADHRTVEFHSAVRIAGTLVPAGSYDVRHTMEGSEHIMVFSPVGSHNKPLVRAKCTLVPVDSPVEQTETGIVKNAAGEPVLVRLQFRGDKALHMIADSQ